MILITDNEAWEICNYEYKDKTLKLVGSGTVNGDGLLNSNRHRFLNVNIDFNKFMLWILQNKDGFITVNNVLLWIESHWESRGEML